MSATRPRPCSLCARHAALFHIKRALREAPLDGRAALLLSSAALELERDPRVDARAVLALSDALLGARVAPLRRVPQRAAA